MLKKRKRTQPEISVPVASMGDIAFLLIIFFMICSTFVKETNVVLDPPLHPDVALLEEPRIVVSMDKEKSIWLQGVKDLSVTELELGVAALVTQFTTNASEEQKKTLKFVRFKCHNSLTREEFEPVIEAITKAGGIIAAVGDEGNPEEKKSKK